MYGWILYLTLYSHNGFMFEKQQTEAGLEPGFTGLTTATQRHLPYVVEFNIENYIHTMTLCLG